MLRLAVVQIPALQGRITWSMTGASQASKLPRGSEETRVRIPAAAPTIPHTLITLLEYNRPVFQIHFDVRNTSHAWTC